MGENKDYLSGWWDAQQKVITFWQEAGKQFEPKQMSDLFARQMEMFGGKDTDAGKLFMQAYSDWVENSNKACGEFAKWFPEGASRQTMEKMLQAFNVWTNLYSFWGDMEKKPGKDEAEKWLQFSEKLKENYSQILDAFILQALPDPLRTVMKSPAELVSMSQETCKGIMEPWLEASPQLQENCMEVFKGSRDAYPKLQELLLETHQEACEKILKMPALGQSRETVEKMMGGMNTYLRFVSSSQKFSSHLYKVGYDALETLLEKVGETAKEDAAPESFRDFLRLWWQTNEDAYAELFKSESFSEILGETVDAYVAFKQQSDELAAELISSTLPVSTNKEIDSLAKTVQQLKSNIRDHSMQLKDIDSKLEASISKGGRDG